MKYSKQAWDQLKNKTCDDLVTALTKDGFALDEGVGRSRVYVAPDGRRVAIHYHPGKTFGPNLLKGLFTDLGWSEADLRRLKLIK